MKRLFIFTATVVVSILTPATQAIPMLRISDGVTTVTVVDGDLSDANPTAGAVAWMGSIGSWPVNLVSGLTNPILGYPDLPIMNLSFQNMSSTSGTLSIMFTETGFTSPRGAWTNQSIGGITTGSVTYDIYGVTSNTEFDTTRHLGRLGPLTGTYAAKDAKNYLRISLPVSFTQVITITHASAGITSGSAYLQVPEGGNSGLLLGVGLMILSLLFGFRRSSI